MITNLLTYIQRCEGMTHSYIALEDNAHFFPKRVSFAIMQLPLNVCVTVFKDARFEQKLQDKNLNKIKICELIYVKPP